MKKRYMILHFKSTVMNNWKVQKVRRLQPLHSHPETRIKEASRAKNMFNMILTRIWSENPLWLGICMKRIVKREWSEHPVQLENDNTPKTKTKSCKISRDFSTVLPSSSYQKLILKMTCLQMWLSNRFFVSWISYEHDTSYYRAFHDLKNQSSWRLHVSIWVVFCLFGCFRK